MFSPAAGQSYKSAHSLHPVDAPDGWCTCSPFRLGILATMMMRRAPKDTASRRAAPRSMPAKADKKPSLDTFIQNGDFTGAIALLEFERRAGTETPMTLPWLGYSAFHLGDYKKALNAYQV